MSEESIKRWTQFLTIGLIFQVLGWSHEAFVNSTSLNSILFLNFNISDVAATFIDKGSAFILPISAILLLLTKNPFFALPLVSYALITSASTLFLHSSFGFELSFLTSAARIGLPLTLYYLYEDRFRLKTRTLFIAKLFLALTFFGHGIEAMVLHPKFIDFTIDSFGTFTGLNLTESSAGQFLIIVAFVDIIVALMAMFSPNTKVFAWMFFWGLMTAILRLTYFGFDTGAPLMLVRSSHWILPLFLMHIQYLQDKDKFTLKKKDFLYEAI